MLIETDRLILRELTHDDLAAWYEILSDPVTMQHYPAPFDIAKTERWINWNIENYATFGFGLFAVILKESGKFIGDCGITMQNINGKIKPEIGYHIHKDYQRRGFASEAAKACRDFIFENTTFNAVWSYMKHTNIASYTVALKNGMTLVEQYDDPVNTISRSYRITRDEWQQLKSKS